SGAIVLRRPRTRSAAGSRGTPPVVKSLESLEGPLDHGLMLSVHPIEFSQAVVAIDDRAAGGRFRTGIGLVDHEMPDPVLRVLMLAQGLKGLADRLLHEVGAFASRFNEEKSLRHP